MASPSPNGGIGYYFRDDGKASDASTQQSLVIPPPQMVIEIAT